jgi:heterodisulfide reductase subunit A
MNKDDSDQELRMGAFICKCGAEIGEYIDIPDLVKYAKNHPDVVKAIEMDFACLKEGLKTIQDSIEKDKLNRVVVAACSPKTHGSIFMKAVEDAGLNKYLLYMVNLREQCSWVHTEDKEKATQKGKDLLSMGLARATHLEPKDELKIPVHPTALIVGGGVSGMTSALSLANLGFETHLVEKEKELGGLLNKLHTLYQTNDDSKKSITPLMDSVMAHEKIQIHTSSALKDLNGHVGNFEVIIDKEGEEKVLKIGSIIVATGAEDYKPKGLYGYGDYKNVVTMSELEEMMRENNLPSKLQNVAFITCTGSRGQDKEYCSRICCTVTVKNAMKILDMVSKESRPEEGKAALEEKTTSEISVKEAEKKEEEEGEERRGRRRERRERRRDRRGARRERGEERRPGRSEGVEVTVFNRGITTYGVKQELLYNQAREQRVKFVRYIPDNPPKVSMEDDKLTLSYFHETLKTDRTTNPDLIVLATPLVQRKEAKDLSQILKVPLGQDEFFLEAHPKLRPLDFSSEGIFICGTARGPANVHECVMQAYGAVAHASAPLARGYIIAEAFAPSVDEERCSGCKTCELVCPVNAIYIDEEKKIANLIAAACKGCGACGASCPEKAINMSNFTDEQLLAEGIAGLKGGSA